MNEMRRLINLMESVLTENTQIVPLGNDKVKHVLLSDHVVKHIETHNQIGIGSVFAQGLSVEDIKKAISNAGVQGDGGAYTVSMPGVGYNLVLPIEQAKGLPDAQMSTVQKDERGQAIEVPAVSTSAPLKSFATDQLTLIIRPSNPQFLPDDVKASPDIKRAVEEGNSYSVLTAFPGDPNIPPASQWDGKFAVILPKG